MRSDNVIFFETSTNTWTQSSCLALHFNLNIRTPQNSIHTKRLTESCMKEHVKPNESKSVRTYNPAD